LRRLVKLAAAALILGGALYAFAPSVRIYLSEQRSIATQRHVLAVLRSENSKLGTLSSSLNTDATIEKIARQDGLVKAGQQAFMVLPAAASPAEPQASRRARHTPWYSHLEFWHYL